ncbi:F-box/kelch-repeat protein At3g06240-like isoform X8 [Fagus crenata]
MQSLVLLDQHNKAEKEPNNPLSPERNPREATNTSSDARPLRVKYPSLPSWEVQVTNDSGEGETLIVPRSKHVPYVPWTGGLVEVDFVEECYSLIGSIKNWIWSSSQSSFARQNKLSHEIDLLRNRVESQASIIRTLERCLLSFGPCETEGSSDPRIWSSSQSSFACQNNISHEIDLLHDEAEMEHDTPPFPKRNSREATNTSSDARFLRVKYPSLPSGEVLVTNDSGEGESLLVPRSKHVPYVPWTGGLVEVDFVEECCSLIESMKNWIWSSSQSSFARQNKLSHEIDLLQNRVESQASTIRTLERCLWSFGPREAGGSSDPIPDAAGVTPLADEGNPMNTTVQSKDGSSRCVTRLAP